MTLAQPTCVDVIHSNTPARRSPSPIHLVATAVRKAQHPLFRVTEASGRFGHYPALERLLPAESRVRWAPGEVNKVF